MSVKRNVKRNRKRRSRVLWQPFTGAIGMIVLAYLCYFFLSDKNQALVDEIRLQQQELDRLDKQCVREEARWNAMKSSERLELSMRSHGIAMNLPAARQVVRMDSDGVPREGQVSVAYLRALVAGNVAKAELDR
jgi:hypothetical protein